MKVFRLVLVAAVVVVVIKVVGLKKGFSWESIFEKMPDDAPPKWMFNNISAIREQNDRIIELLEGQQGDG